MDDLCTSCLCVGRNLYLINETGLYDIFLQILNEIPVNDMSNLCIRICWECRAELRRYQTFKKRTIQCYSELTMFLLRNSSESKLSLAKPSRLQIHNTTDCPQIEIKRELDVDDDSSHAADHLDMAIDAIDDVKSERSDTETHCEPETFVKDLRVRKGRQKRKETIKNKEKKITKEKNTKKPITKKKKAKIKNRKVSLSSNNSINAGDVCKISELESTSDEKVKGEKERVDPAAPVNERDAGEFTCDDCGRSFEVKSELESHISSEHCNKRTPKNGAVVKMRKTVRASEDILAERPECVECGKVFSSRKTYRYHLNVLHEGHNRYPCPRCGKVYQWKSNLGRHMRSHKAKDLGELHCDVCDKRFASIATYRQHLRVSRRHVSESEFTVVKSVCDCVAVLHRLVISFMCNECGKKFVNKTRLRDHIDWEHLKKIKFRCQLCNKPFKCHTSLYVHMQNVHRNKEKKDNLCHVCGKSYQNAAKLKYHIVAMHTSETPYQCEQCSSAFGWYSSLYRHVREVHYKMKLQPKKAKKTKKAAEVLPSMMQHQMLPPVEPGYLEKTLAHTRHTPA